MMRQTTGWMSDDHRKCDSLFARGDKGAGSRDRAAARIWGGMV